MADDAAALTEVRKHARQLDCLIKAHFPFVGLARKPCAYSRLLPKFTLDFDHERFTLVTKLHACDQIHA